MTEELKEQNKKAFMQYMTSADSLSKQQDVNETEKAYICERLGMCRMLAILHIADNFDDDDLLDEYNKKAPEILKRINLPFNKVGCFKEAAG